MTRRSLSPLHRESPDIQERQMPLYGAFHQNSRQIRCFPRSRHCPDWPWCNLLLLSCCCWEFHSCTSSPGKFPPPFPPCLEDEYSSLAADTPCPLFPRLPAVPPPPAIFALLAPVAAAVLPPGPGVLFVLEPAPPAFPCSTTIFASKMAAVMAVPDFTNVTSLPLCKNTLCIAYAP